MFISKSSANAARADTRSGGRLRCASPSVQVGEFIIGDIAAAYSSPLCACTIALQGGEGGIIVVMNSRNTRARGDTCLRQG